MGAGHHHDHQHPGVDSGGAGSAAGARLAEARVVTFVGAAIGLALSGAKLGIGVFAGSQALVADGVHSLGDLVSDGIVWVSLRLAGRPADGRFPFGLGKIENLAGFVVGLLLAGSALTIAGSAVTSLVSPPPDPVRGWLLPLAALASVATKEWLFRWTLRVGRRLESPALVANAWHHRSDALSSIAVLVGLLGAAVAQITWMDAVAALFVALILARVSWGILSECGKGLLDAGLAPELLAGLREAAVSDPAVADVHDLRAWRAGSIVLVELHAVVHGDMTVREGCRVASRVEVALRRTLPRVGRVQVHLEPARDGIIVRPAVNRDGVTIP